MKTLRFAYVGEMHHACPRLMAALHRAGRLEAATGSGAEQAVERYHVRWAYDDVGQMLRDSEPDGVVIGLPLSERAPVIRHCLARGVGVLVPGAPGMARDCRRIASLSMLSARVVLASSPMRFSPVIMLARRLIDSGRTARPISLSFMSAWRAAETLDSPIARDQAYEAIELVQTLLGPIQKMQALGHAEGVLAAQGMSAHGVLTTILLHARSAAESAGCELEIRAGDGTRLHLNREGRMVCGNGSRLDAFYGPSPAAADPVVESGYLGLVQEFARLLRNGGCGLTREAAQTARLAEQICRQAARGLTGLDYEPDSAIESMSRNPLSMGPL